MRQRNPCVSAAQREEVPFTNAGPAIRLSHLEVDEVEAQLADVLVHRTNFQLAILHVTRHNRRKVGRDNVRDVVNYFLVAGCHDCKWTRGEK